ncbi:7383_t:CDS:2 [Entrophospora sp. SA101]|nr:7383_t:CDS:2 [Entrophospora sp. SA101]
MDDDTVKHYETKLRGCKTKEDLEKFTSEVVFFIQVYARARDAGYFKKADEVPKTKPAPKTETRSIGSDDPRPKYTFTGSDKAFCCEDCRTDYFKNASSNSYNSYSSYAYTPSSSSSGSSDVEFKLSLKSVSEEKLNKKLGAEYTCANCGVVKDNYYPWEKEGKKYCSLDCQDSKDKKNTKSLGISSLKEFFNWMRKMGAVEVKFDLTTNQIIVKCNDGEKKLNLATSGLSLKLQEELKHAKEPITFSQVSKALDQKNKKNDNAAIFGAILLAGIILAVIIGVVVYNKKKRDY